MVGIWRWGFLWIGSDRFAGCFFVGSFLALVMVVTDLVKGVRSGWCWSCFSWGFSTPPVMRRGGPFPVHGPKSVHASFLRESLGFGG